MATHTVYLGLGSNLGDREQNLSTAVRHIHELIGEVTRQSAFYFSHPWGFTSDNDFVNLCLCCQTTLSPMKLLTVTQHIERLMGRKEKSKDGEYHDRIIDIDILLYDELHLHTEKLTIPHPLMRERDFVMVPLREILPEDYCW